MNKKEIINTIASETGEKKIITETIVNSVFDTITRELIENEKVAISGFGTFEVRTRAEKTARNPRTNEPILVPASKAVGFKVSKSLKEAVKNL